MNERLLEPLKYYETEGKAKHEENVKSFLDGLIAKSGINADENRATVKKYYAEKGEADKLSKKARRFKLLRVLLIITAVVGGLTALLTTGAYGQSIGLGLGLTLGGIALLVGSIILIIKKINPALKQLNEIINTHLAKASEHYATAEAQMAPLNALFDERDTVTLLETTLPEINFEDTFSKEQEELFRKKYDFMDMVSDECSVTNLMSGSFEGNPFLFCRCLLHEMKTKTYHGSLVISWTETYRDSQGKTRTRRRTQTLHASVTKPKPYYHYNTYLCYGNQAAPDLSFSRKPQVTAKMDEDDIEKKVRKGAKKLQKKSAKAISNGGSFQEMANTEFEVLFGATNRSNEVQFRLMYTPLAQTNTVDLITSKTGYGDDFYFMKQNRFNMITTNHAQGWKMDTSPANYYSFDIDESIRRFTEFNNEYFKSVFFDFAPLLSVPAYLEEPCSSLHKPDEYESNYPYYEHEALANSLDRGLIAPPNATEELIIKTNLTGKSGLADNVQATAYSYFTVERVDYIPVFGGDGRTHLVPVPWVEYIPTQNTVCLDISRADMTKKEYNSRRSVDNSLINSAYAHGIIAKLL